MFCHEIVPSKLMCRRGTDSALAPKFREAGRGIIKDNEMPKMPVDRRAQSRWDEMRIDGWMNEWMDTPAWRAVWELNGPRWIQLKTLTNYGKVHEKANTQILQQKEGETQAGKKKRERSWKVIEVLGNSNEKRKKAEGKLQPKLQAEMFSEINSINRAKYF